MRGVARTAMNIVRNEQGSALLVVLIVIVVLSILGGVLLNVLRVDNKGTASVVAGARAEAMAQMGLDEALTLIREALVRGEQAAESAETNVRIARAQQINMNLATLEEYRDVIKSASDGSESGEYNIEIKKSIASQPNANAPDAPYSYRLEIVSTGSVKVPIQMNVKKQLVVYVSDILPVFRYAVSTSEDGAVTLNGSPSVIGDGLIYNNLVVNDAVSYFDENGNRQTISAVAPFWRGFLKSSGSAVSTDEVQKQIAWPAPFVEKVNVEDVPPPGFSPNAIVAAKVQSASLLSGVIQPISDDEAGTELGRGVTVREGCSVKCGLDSFNTDVQFRDWVTVIGNNLATDDDLTISGHLLVNDELSDGAAFRMENNARLVIREGSLYVRQKDENISAADLSGEIVMLDDDDRPARNAEIVINGNATLSDFKYNGSMYVQGDVKIIGNLNMQGVLYVAGSVDLKDMRSINPPQTESDDSLGEPLVIVANGKISLNSYRDDSLAATAGKSLASKPINIRAYLYSNDDVELFGIVSSYRIIGGLFGKTVTLNALRGDFASVPQPGLQQASLGYYFEDQKQPRFLRNEDPRLQILYDPRLFSNPPYGIPWMNDVRLYVTESKNGK